MLTQAEWPHTEAEYAAAQRAIEAALPDRPALCIDILPTLRGHTVYAGKPNRVRAFYRAPKSHSLDQIVEAVIAKLKAED